MRRSLYPLTLLLISTVGMALLAGCATNSNEGAVDYRKAAPPIEPDDPAAEGMHKPLLHKDATISRTGTIAKLDKLSIRLRDGYLAGCNESKFKKNPLRHWKLNCEIGILVRVFEIGDTQDFNFKNDLRDG